MRRVPVESTSIDSVGYENEVLEVRFRNGGLYQYLGVPQLLHDLLMRSDSKGRFFNDRVRDRFRCVRLKPGRQTARLG